MARPKKTTKITEATEINQAIIATTASQLVQTAVTIAPLVPSESFNFKEYTFEYYPEADGQYRPILKKAGKLIFSGWNCKDYQSAKSLIVPIYYQMSGLLKGSTAEIRSELLAVHPLSALIYEKDNTPTLENAIAAEGNQTGLYRVVVNPYGLVLSGNTRLAVLDRLAKSTGVPQMISVVISNGEDDVSIIVGGNRQREKTPQDFLNEAIALTKQSGVTKKFWTGVRDSYIKLSGFSGGHFDAVRAVAKFVEKNENSEIAQTIGEIANSNPTIALDILKLQQATQSADGVPLEPEAAASGIARELSRIAGASKAKPVEIHKQYAGIEKDIAAIRRHYTAEAIGAIASALADCPAHLRSQLVSLKEQGDKRKLSILVEDLIEAEDTTAESASGTNWNVENEKEPESETVADPHIPYYRKMRQSGVFEDGCWVTNEVTAIALNAAIGGAADVDPFAEPTGHIKCDRRLLAIDNPLSMESWGGGPHAPGNGITVATALPPTEGLVPCFKNLMERLGTGEITKMVAIVDASVLFIPRFGGFFKSLPLAWVMVARENNIEATAGFGFEPGGFIQNNPRYKRKTAADWNESARSYIILYYGKDYNLFESACGKFGNVCYNAKASTVRSLEFEWSRDEDGSLSAISDGYLFQITQIGDGFYLYQDGVRGTDRYRTAEHAKRAAIIQAIA